MGENEKPRITGEVIQIDDARIRDHLGEMIRGTVEEALNAMLDTEANRPGCVARFQLRRWPCAIAECKVNRLAVKIDQTIASVDAQVQFRLFGFQFPDGSIST